MLGSLNGILVAFHVRGTGVESLHFNKFFLHLLAMIGC